MKKKITFYRLLSISALLACMLTVYLIYKTLSPARDTMFIFNASYPAGQQITADMLNPLQVDSTIIEAGKKESLENRFITPEEYATVISSGDSLRIDVSEGMPLTTSMLSVTGGTSVEMNMTSTAIAVTVPVDSYSGITDELKAGAHVNVYSSIDSKVQMIQQNKRVLEVYKDSDSGFINGVSIEETAEESMELIYATTYGQVYLGLVNPTGYQSVEGADPVYMDEDASVLSDAYIQQLNDEIKNETAAPGLETETENDTSLDPGYFDSGSASGTVVPEEF